MLVRTGTLIPRSAWLLMRSVRAGQISVGAVTVNVMQPPCNARDDATFSPAGWFTIAPGTAAGKRSVLVRAGLSRCST